MPFFDTAGILARDRETATFLFEQSPTFSRESNISGMELRQDRPLNIPDMTIKGAVPKVYHAKVELRIRISGSQQNIMAGFKSKLRSQIYKGKKNGLTWNIGKKTAGPFLQDGGIQKTLSNFGIQYVTLVFNKAKLYSRPQSEKIAGATALPVIRPAETPFLKLHIPRRTNKIWLKPFL
ncbi:hypothetical protein [Desulfobacula sp.]|uniref:hypothetical protein n=1 Tax=Desulfobacula sp. TaxID=2593537 RepID=UPI00260833D8|nr:hypothetical protein [Desulfobacula sp.]